MTTLHGITNCDTVRKARTWLADHRVAHRFHDFRKDGLDLALLDAWVDRLGWEPLLNRAGTTFRKLPEQDRVELDRARATALMLAQPAMIRRPVLVHDGGVEVGFKPERYAALFG
ncbi:ArsC family reductase [Sphingomonas sp. BK580]|uniref:ArsC family reductase n=1 Tax=Sphingomonas sp. BK580 TaxID=2586972 RepID=UPI001613C2C4|nr:ArsC family reductase [Sphingomonas sp. BK580]MBB3692847.1 Spx/MgsR family transcriptional regulator [Sphingomonas sp. BK580]